MPVAPLEVKENRKKGKKKKNTAVPCKSFLDMQYNSPICQFLFILSSLVQLLLRKRTEYLFIFLENYSCRHKDIFLKHKYFQFDFKNSTERVIWFKRNVEEVSHLMEK